MWKVTNKKFKKIARGKGLPHFIFGIFLFMQIVCKKCGLVDDYRTELKNGQKVAHCNGCDSFIKNIPYQPARFYFGKYKDTLIEQCDDLQYCEWFLGNTNPKANIKLAVINRIIDLKKEVGNG